MFATYEAALEKRSSLTRTCNFLVIGRDWDQFLHIMASIRFFLAVVGCLGWAADAQDNSMMIELYEEALEEALELESGGWHKLMQASSRGDTASSIATLAAACKKTRGGESGPADLSPLNDLHELYGIFRNGSAKPNQSTPDSPPQPFDTTQL
jgi:hypothetical protein